jgi:hypothetical protein
MLSRGWGEQAPLTNHFAALFPRRRRDGEKSVARRRFFDISERRRPETGSSFLRRRSRADSVTRLVDKTSSSGTVKSAPRYRRDPQPCDLQPCDLQPCDLQACDLQPCAAPSTGRTGKAEGDRCPSAYAIAKIVRKYVAHSH